jgi:hypothetical protein
LSVHVSEITFIRYAGITFIRYVSGITFIRYVSGISFIRYAQNRKIGKIGTQIILFCSYLLPTNFLDNKIWWPKNG